MSKFIEIKNGFSNPTPNSTTSILDIIIKMFYPAEMELCLSYLYQTLANLQHIYTMLKYTDTPYHE